jgi:elongation factor P
MYATSDFKKGLKVDIEGVPYEIVDFQHVSPGKGRAFTRTKFKNLLNQNMLERTITSGDKLPRADVEFREMQYLYIDGDGFQLMDNENYEQIAMNEKNMGAAKDFLKENIVLKVMFYNGLAIGVELPTFVELKIVQTDPVFKGDTVTGATKPAKLESGASVLVPYHIKEGDVIKVDTRDSSYSEKVNR